MTNQIPTLSKEGQEAVGQITGVTGSLLSALIPYLSSNPGSSRAARIAQEWYEAASVWAVKAVVNHEKGLAANDQENLPEKIKEAIQANIEDNPEIDEPRGTEVFPGEDNPAGDPASD